MDIIYNMHALNILKEVTRDFEFFLLPRIRYENRFTCILSLHWTWTSGVLKARCTSFCLLIVISVMMPRFSGPMLSTRLESKQKDFEERYDQIFNVNNKVCSLGQFCTFHKLFFAVSRVIFPTVALLPRNPEFNFPNQKYLYLLLHLCPCLWGCTW